MELLFEFVAHLIGHTIAWAFTPVKEEEEEARYYAKHSVGLVSNAAGKLDSPEPRRG